MVLKGINLLGKERDDLLHQKIGGTVKRDFHQNTWDEHLERDLQKLIEIAVSEDHGDLGDLTSRSLIPQGIQGRAGIHVRVPGVIAGLQAVPVCLAAIDPDLRWYSNCKDGQFVLKGAKVGEIVGPVLGMLTSERLLLNILGHLCGVATLTHRFVDKIKGTGAKIYDTRKTTLGWRRLEKYAVRCGGGYNHRTGLFDAILIKDNHLAFGALPGNVLDSDHSANIGENDPAMVARLKSCIEHRSGMFSPGEAVARARRFLGELRSELEAQGRTSLFPEGEIPLVEIEMDSLEHFEEVLDAEPDIVLLDNMGAEKLAEAVKIRNRRSSSTELEASGGIKLDIVREMAETGVERLSVGSLTHSNFSLDIGMDWEE